MGSMVNASMLKAEFVSNIMQYMLLKSFESLVRRMSVTTFHHDLAPGGFCDRHRHRANPKSNPRLSQVRSVQADLVDQLLALERSHFQDS